MTTLAVLVIFQPFVDLAEAIIKFFAEDVGLSWGWAIVALTFTVRLLTLPLSITGIRSMRRMQLVAPELKEVQQKYKDDRERQQREMLALYKRARGQPARLLLPVPAPDPVLHRRLPVAARRRVQGGRARRAATPSTSSSSPASSRSPRARRSGS